MTEVATPQLAKWSWQDITKVYQNYGEQLKEYARMRPIFGIDEAIDLVPKPGQMVPVESFENVLAVGRWFTDVTRINDHIKMLDHEIARRNKLIGVMG